jgi:CHRD domain
MSPPTQTCTRLCNCGADAAGIHPSPQGQKGVGDPNGRGAFSAILDGRQLCYGIEVTNIGKPAAAHIHIGGPKVAGPIVQPLDPPSAGNPGQSGDCVRLPAKLAKAIGKNPAKYYVNVHNVKYPGGAIRGQLSAR